MTNVLTPQSLRVLMFAQKVDEQDWLIGFAVDWMRALAARVHTLDVVALESRGADLPPNVTVHSLGKERGNSRLQQLITFNRIVAGLSSRTDLFFGHLTPRYTWLAAPYAIARRVPQCLWYTHRHSGPELQMALRSVRWIATAAPDSFPIRSPKVRVMGHGVDSERFSPGNSAPDDPPLVIAVGRIAPIKHHHSLLEAAARLRDQGIAARFAVAGGIAQAEGEAYQAQLKARIGELDMSERFILLGPVQGQALIDLLRRATIVTNLSPVGLFDKAALEAMMTARPVLTANAAFDDLLGDRVNLLRASAPDDVVDVTAKLAGLLALTPAERAEIGVQLRAQAVKAHSLNRLMDRLVELWMEPV